MIGHYFVAERAVTACLTVNIGMECSVYAGGRPLWHLSLAAHDMAAKRPVPVLRWGPTTRRKIEHIRDRIMRGLGTLEAYVGEEGVAAIHWRKPLRIEEVNQLAPTAEVRARLGRP